MVLDPMTALSVATSVVQFVDFGTKLISKSREIYKSADGVLADHAEQAAVSSKLADLTRRLSTFADGYETKLSSAEKALQEVALDCLQVANEFGCAIDQLMVNGKHRKWKSLRQALKSVWKKEEMEERLVRLDRLRQLVIVHLLVVINEGQGKSFAGITHDVNRMESRIVAGVCQSIGEMKQQVDDLSETLSKLAKEQSNDRHDHSEEINAKGQLVDRWLEQNQAALSHIIENANVKNAQEKRLSYQQKVLDSLYFGNIDDRQNMIDQKAQVTLNWVFDPPSEMPLQWTVPSWLHSSNGLYWVSGKAGSGKSTMMKWILHEDQTRSILESWAGDRRLLVAQYFFWSSGTDIQKSLLGLLRSLLYELLRQWPDAIPYISPARWRSYDLDLAHFPTWTNADLVFSIRNFFRHVSPSASVCIFIDGLDELDGDDDQRLEVIHLLKELSGYPHVKLCISSRPWEIFKDAFASCPNLRLEDLTRKDIENYINGKVQANETFQLLRQNEDDLCCQLVNEIIDKAQGVWLWVVLVVRSLLRGLRNQDTATDLLDRLREIPEEVEKCLLQMFSKIESDYRLKALKLLKISLNSPPGLSLMTCCFMDEESLSGRETPGFPYSMPIEVLPEDEVMEWLKLTDSRVNIVCLGLLETIYRPNHHLFFRHGVEFLHRTARDFLADCNTQKLIGMESVASFNVNEFMCKALLAQIKISHPTRLLLADFMYYAARLEDESGSPQRLLDHLNHVLDLQRDQDYSDDSLPNCSVKEWRCDNQGPVPLLSVAIQYGLTRYAKDHLTLSPALVMKQPDRPLLDYALRRRIYSTSLGQAEQLDHPVGGSRDQPDVELVRMILEQGGDPNKAFGNSTVWRYFLEFLDIFSADLQSLDEKEKEPWIEVTELMIRHGAVRVLETETVIPRQSTGRTRVNLSQRRLLARRSVSAAFGEEEAARLDLLSWWLNATGQNLSTTL
ncbi:hypothetical protein MW887_000692 [Aspergillus wentii]|nr:hypothetical protein MW887_000692 [Aspergillus wentii]